MKYLKTFDKAKNKEVTCGYIDGDTYHRKVNNKHYMVKEKGYGIQSNIVNKLFSDRVKNVMIHTKTMDLKTTLNTWIIRGHRADYGNGEQVFLDTSFMEKL
jgi:hypothetical protein